MKKSKLQRSTNNTIAVFGSAFNPPHRGHEDVVKQVSKVADLVVLVPSYRHAFGKQMAPFEQRLAMVHAMTASLRNVGRIRVSDIERKLSVQKARGEAIYTYDVLCAIEDESPGASLIFVMGPDNAEPAT